MGHAWQATGRNGFGNFRAGQHHWDTLGRQRGAMDLVTFGLGITTGTRLGGNARQWIWSCFCWESLLGHAWEATGDNGFDNFRFGYWDTLREQRVNGFGNLRAGNHYWDTLGGNGRQWIVTCGLGITTGHAWEATGGNGFGNFRDGNHNWDTLGRQRKATESSAW